MCAFLVPASNQCTRRGGLHIAMIPQKKIHLAEAELRTRARPVFARRGSALASSSGTRTSCHLDKGMIYGSETWSSETSVPAPGSDRTPSMTSSSPAHVARSALFRACQHSRDHRELSQASIPASDTFERSKQRQQFGSKKHVLASSRCKHDNSSFIDLADKRGVCTTRLLYS
ncbi:uncharacterized protein UTRI_04717 [Ustilago trichophora]|uniref:Uncharacterized protein n=1 Tax=Ustilago trichophora TaxID=86804 RepID=A0A5C3EDM4_9BASI|nr:uncharacterized protein UTRI_04717 [Ustilago trichophora]